MQTKIKRSILGMTLAAALLLTACAPQEDAVKNPEVTVAPQEEKGTLQLTDTTVLATVNGEDVSWADVSGIYGALSDYFAFAGESISAEEKHAMAMNAAVEQTLMNQKAKEWGITLTEEEQTALTAAAEEEWNTMLSTVCKEVFGVTDSTPEEELSVAETAAKALLAERGYAESWYVTSALNSALNERVEAKITEGVTVSDDDVQQSYTQRVAADEGKYADDVYNYELDTVIYGGDSWYTPEGYRYISWILLYVDDNLLADYRDKAAMLEEGVEMVESGEGENASSVTQEELTAMEQEMLASVQPTVQEILAKSSEGTAFGELVATYGNDFSWMGAEAAPVGRPISRDSVIWDPAIVRAAYTLDTVGQISTPVLGNAGVYLVCYMGDVPAGGVTLTADREETLYTELLSEKKGTLVEETVASWRESAQATYTDDGLQWLRSEE